MNEPLPPPGGPPGPRPPAPAAPPPAADAPRPAAPEAPAPEVPAPLPFEARLRDLEREEHLERKGKKHPEKAGKAEKAEKADKKSKDEKKEESRRSRGVETLFRTSYAVNMDLTALADSKANIMVSVNGLMITVLVGSVAPGIDTNRWLIFPTAVLLAGITTALVLGVLAARPRVEGQRVSLDDVRQRRANLLFFGNFANMSREDFVAGMKELMDQPDEVYRSMTADLYGIGSVLQKKYRLLRWSYIAFLVGIAAGVLAFLVTFYFFTPSVDPQQVYVTPAPGAVAPGAAPQDRAPIPVLPPTPVPNP